jgi:hypothetical protein
LRWTPLRRLGLNPIQPDRAREAWLLIGREGFADRNRADTGPEGQQFVLSSRFTSASADAVAGGVEQRSEGTESVLARRNRDDPVTDPTLAWQVDFVQPIAR